MDDLATLRNEYLKARLDAESTDPDPVVQFEKWLREARNAGVMEPAAMNLATVNADGRPSGRVVLLKGIEKRKLIFYTNYRSRKGNDLDNNPACALTFFWAELERQVRVEGVAFRIDEARSDAYFKSRPRGAQLGAWASPQSSIINDRNILDERMSQIEKRFKESEPVPRPHQWGGYEVEPLIIEFWQGRENRLHDRLQYVFVDSVWQCYRIAP